MFKKIPKYFYLGKAWIVAKEGGYCETTLAIDSGEIIKWEDEVFGRNAEEVIIEYYELLGGKMVYQGKEVITREVWSER